LKEVPAAEFIAYNARLAGSNDQKLKVSLLTLLPQLSYLVKQ